MITMEICSSLTLQTENRLSGVSSVFSIIALIASIAPLLPRLVCFEPWQSPKIRLSSCSLYWILKYRICHRVRAHLSEPISMRAATEHTYVSDLKQFQELVFKMRSAEWSQDGKRIMTADDMSTRVWDAANGEQVSTLEGHARIAVTGEPVSQRRGVSFTYLFP